MAEFNEKEPEMAGEGTRDAYINVRYGYAASLAVSVVSGVLGLLLLA